MEVFENMLVGTVIDAHGVKWYRIKYLGNDLENGRRLYLAAKIGDELPAATYVVGEDIDPVQLERLRASEAKYQAEFAAIGSKKR